MKNMELQMKKKKKKVPFEYTGIIYNEKANYF